MVQTEIPRVGEFTKNIQENWEHAAQAMEEAQKNMKRVKTVDGGLYFIASVYFYFTFHFFFFLFFYF